MKSSYLALSIIAFAAKFSQILGHGTFINPKPRAWGGYNLDKDTFPLHHSSGETPWDEGTCRGISKAMDPTRLGTSFSVEFGSIVNHKLGSPCRFELRDLSLNVIHTIQEFPECFEQGPSPKQLNIPQDAADKCGDHCVLYWHWEANHLQPAGQPKDPKLSEIYETCADVTFGSQGNHNVESYTASESANNHTSQENSQNTEIKKDDVNNQQNQSNKTDTQNEQHNQAAVVHTEITKDDNHQQQYPTKTETDIKTEENISKEKGQSSLPDQSNPTKYVDKKSRKCKS